MLEKDFHDQISQAFGFFREKIQEGNWGIFFVCDKENLGISDFSFGWGKDVLESKFSTENNFVVSDFLGNDFRNMGFEHMMKGEDFSPESNPLPPIPSTPLRDRAETDQGPSLRSDGNQQKDTLNFRASLSEEAFCGKIEKIQQYQEDGESWVMNFTQNLTSTLNGQPQGLPLHHFFCDFFQKFLAKQKSFCGGVMILPDMLCASLSPEVFIEQKGGKIFTYPIKGSGKKEDLENSAKEISELQMVTDLLRNDLGQICEKVSVEEERFLTDEGKFHHAQSKICGEISSKNFTEEAYLSLLPAGSISGSPKKRVLEITKELENFDRRFYTGTFGFRFSEERFISNILIRSLFHYPQESATTSEKFLLEFPVGAGITIESNPREEYQETLMKSQDLEF